MSTRATAAPPGNEKAGRSACGLLFVRLAQVSRTRLTAALQDMGLRPPEFAVLHALADSGASTQLDLARAIRIHPSNLVGLLDGLEAGGWIERTRDPDDRRRHLVALTQAGAKLLVAAQRAAEAAERELLQPLSRAEREQLEGLLRRLAAHSCGGPR
jgi:MarR family transcriptional regulator, lower aerobic nicotinate degradation pathway regulator